MEGNWRERREKGKSMHDLVGLGWVYYKYGFLAICYQEKCMRKCSFLGSCPMNVSHKVKTCKLLYFLFSLFSIIFFYIHKFLHTQPKFELLTKVHSGKILKIWSWFALNIYIYIYGFLLVFWILKIQKIAKSCLFVRLNSNPSNRLDKWLNWIKSKIRILN